MEPLILGALIRRDAREMIFLSEPCEDVAKRYPCANQEEG